MTVKFKKNNIPSDCLTALTDNNLATYTYRFKGKDGNNGKTRKLKNHHRSKRRYGDRHNREHTEH